MVLPDRVHPVPSVGPDVGPGEPRPDDDGDAVLHMAQRHHLRHHGPGRLAHLPAGEGERARGHVPRSPRAPAHAQDGCRADQEYDSRLGRGRSLRLSV